MLTIAGATVATAPDAGRADALARALDRLAPEERTAPSALGEHVVLEEVLGPARLAYLPSQHRPVVPLDAAGELVAVPARSAPVAALLDACPAEDVAESGVRDLDSPAFVLAVDGRPVAVAGYERWPSGVAHLCVLTRPGARGARRARAVAAAAAAHALDAGLLPQWRARPEASVRLARALGFVVLGQQLSVRTGREQHRAGRDGRPPGA
ncbi:GNAT family N-acetyltransferase [uncultured Pseudokineococcus sp.]|uniref:GNAT family N-acetyltransferase n=1 Tax=uncultured Pseudokineococcus sp. TaxID=1642928 RepID=UPI00260B56AA|nr:GNAT family N-acetyltransferase [uncultured Pseudokineococcus sp.]